MVHLRSGKKLKAVVNKKRYKWENVDHETLMKRYIPQMTIVLIIRRWLIKPKRLIKTVLNVPGEYHNELIEFTDGTDMLAFGKQIKAHYFYDDLFNDIDKMLKLEEKNLYHVIISYIY